MSKLYDGKAIYDHIHFVIQRGDRAALLGPNGAGKTTLMRILRGEADFDGERRAAPGVYMGVFSQEEMDQLAGHRTVFEELLSVSGDYSQGQVRSLLGAFLFSGDDAFKKVSVLSGGEKSRLLLCKIFVQPVNLLLLDEPTNHLDIASRKILEGALREFEGTICLVTHDRHLINAVVNEVVFIRNRKLEIFPGNFDDFASIWNKRQPSLSRRNEVDRAPQERAPKKTTRTRKRAEAEWRNRLFRETAPLKKRLVALEKKIEDSTREMDDIASQLAENETYRSPQRLRELSGAYQTLKRQVADWTREWETLALTLERVEYGFEEVRPRSEDY